MTWFLLLCTLVIFAGVLLYKVSDRFGFPVLLAFIFLGMLLGSDWLLRIPFEDYGFAEQICSVALIFIMFYGGFGTKWSAARPVAVKAALLSSLGTVITAGLVGLFCHFALGIAWLESFLIGSVIGSTDAASVFSILRSKRLNLKHNTASLLEVESGSNDPFSYMLTVLCLSLMNNAASGRQFVYLLFSQLVYGLVFGVGVALLARLFFKKFRFADASFEAIFVVAVALLAYAAPTAIGGNGYLSVYITGIILGNNRIPHKQPLVHFFDGITNMMQMLLFFLLGLLAFPSQLPEIALPALGIALFLTFVARPVAVSALLTPFRCPVRQQLLVAWSGMRGAASIVFAIMTVVNPAVTDNDIFHIVFFIVLFSISVQGTLLPPLSRALAMTDNESDVMKTFNDYIEDVPVECIQFTVSDTHPWANRAVRDILLPPESTLMLHCRGDKKTVPKGNTILRPGDVLVLSGKAMEKGEGVHLFERPLEKGDPMIDKTIASLNNTQAWIVLIRRGNDAVIPRGNTRLLENDILVMYDTTVSEE